MRSLIADLVLVRLQKETDPLLHKRLYKAIRHAILDGSLDDAETFTLPMFDLAIPTSLPGVDTHILDPRNTYGSPEQWREKAESLAKLFIENFEKYTDTPAGADRKSV